MLGELVKRDCSWKKNLKWHLNLRRHLKIFFLGGSLRFREDLKFKGIAGTLWTPCRWISQSVKQMWKIGVYKQNFKHTTFIKIMKINWITQKLLFIKFIEMVDTDLPIPMKFCNITPCEIDLRYNCRYVGYQGIAVTYCGLHRFFQQIVFPTIKSLVLDAASIQPLKFTSTVNNCRGFVEANSAFVVITWAKI